MTAPAEKMVDLLDTLPADDRRELTVWLLDRAGRTGSGHAWLTGPQTRGVLPQSAASLAAGSLSSGEDSQLVTIRLPAERHAQLRTWCTDHGFTMAAVVRGLIERFLEEQQETQSRRA
jgi:hypothetical protein